jgi:hypothetical protein
MKTVAGDKGYCTKDRDAEESGMFLKQTTLVAVTQQPITRSLRGHFASISASRFISGRFSPAC